MPKDPWQDPDVKAWLAHTAEELPPKIKDSAIVVSIVPGKTDVKYAVELGMSIMLDKPILCIVKPGTHVPDHLVRVADLIVECDMEDDEDRRKLMASMEEFIAKYAPDKS